MTTGSTGDDRTAERLRELQRLRDEGLITAEEFDAQRTRILDEAFSPDAAPSDADRGDGRPAVPPATPAGPTLSADSSSGGDVGVEVSRSRFHPERWPRWLRITLIVASGLWIVTIPFMFRPRARYTWLPYVGVVTAVLLVVGIVEGDGQESESQPTQPSATAAAPSTPEPTPVRTATSTPTRTAEPTPAPTAEPTPTRTAEPTPAPTAEPTPPPDVEDCFSPWDGNLDALEDLVRPGLNDEGSMETHETRFSRDPDADGYYLVRMEYSAKNAFGARIKTVATGKVRARDCNVILIDPGY